MPESRLIVGFRVGLITGATTAGVLIGFGLRHGEAFSPFQLYGRVLAASLTGLVPSMAAAAAIGVLGHFFWMIVLGTVFAVLVRSQRTWALTLQALLFSAISGWLATRVLPSLLGAATVASLTMPQRLFFLGVLALALVAGTRLAIR